MQALDLSIATQCFLREFWEQSSGSLAPLNLTLAQQDAFAAGGLTAPQDLPRCAEMHANTRVCMVSGRGFCLTLEEFFVVNYTCNFPTEKYL